jgi:competence protein ComFC
MARSPARLLEPILALLFPDRCIGCRVRGTALCDPCRAQLPWLGMEVCPLCASPSRLARLCHRCRSALPVLEGVRAACRFEGIVRRGVHDLKYRRIQGRAPLLAGLIVEAVEQRPLAIDVLVPVPLAAGRRRQRGFNQSELIAQVVGAQIGVPMLTASLDRIRETAPQVGRSAIERRRSVAGVFRCSDAASVAGRRVGLVDDVMTTGATLSACAETLKESGAARVYALVVAHEV